LAHALEFFPPPWSVEEQDACFVVRDNSGQQIAYVYLRMSRAADRRPSLLTKDDAKLPEILRKP
jgi:hypothetical protein